MLDDGVADHRIRERFGHRSSHPTQAEIGAVGARHDTRWRCIDLVERTRREGQGRGGRGFVVRHRVVPDRHQDGVLDRDTAAGQARNIVVDHVVD